MEPKDLSQKTRVVYRTKKTQRQDPNQNPTHSFLQIHPVGENLLILNPHNRTSRETGTQAKNSAEKSVQTKPTYEKETIGYFLKDLTRNITIEDGNIVIRCNPLANAVNKHFNLNIDSNWLLSAMQ